MAKRPAQGEPGRPGPGFLSPATIVRIRLVAWSLALACLYTKCVTSLDPFPYWGSDPTRVVIPITALTPAPSMLLDATALLACALALIADVLSGAGLRRRLFALWAVGTAGAAAHACCLHPATLDDARIGLSWAAALAAGLTAFHVCRDPSIRRITLATAVGITGALIAKGILQYFVEQPDTAASFRKNSDAFLAAQGWTPGSAADRAFRRRLDQDEATGWFGMANVFASFMAAGLTAMLGWAVLAWKKTRANELPSGWSGLLSLGAVLCAAGVWMAGSKGGVGACLLGMALLAAGAISLRLIPRDGSARLARLGGPLAVSLIALALAAIIARGLIGDRLNKFDLSLLFRWHYMIGAARIAVHHPLLGVGPAGFKDAYMLDKPPLSPEDVASPHNVLLDYISTLGAFGIAWAMLLLAWVWHAGLRLTARALQTPQGQPPSSPARPELWAVTLLVFAPSLAGAWFERTLASPDTALARLAGIGAWLGLSVAALSLMRTTVRWRWIAAAGALAMAVHGQIEMTATWPGAAGLFMLLLAAAAAPDADLFPDRRRVDFALAALPGLAGLIALPFLVIPACQWERSLAAAADAVRPTAEITSRWTDLHSDPGATPADLDQLAIQLGGMVNIPPPTTPEAFEVASAILLTRTAAGARPQLESASHRFPAHFPTTEALVRLVLAQAASEQLTSRPDDTRRSVAEATALAEAFAQHSPTASGYGLLGNTHSAAAQLLGDQGRLDAAAQAWANAAAVDPHGPAFALRTLDAYTALGRTDQAHLWAAETLRRDELQRLDPLRRLTDEEHKRVTAALSAP